MFKNLLYVNLFRYLAQQIDSIFIQNIDSQTSKNTILTANKTPRVSRTNQMLAVLFFPSSLGDQ